MFEDRLRPNELRDVVCKVLRKRPDLGNWSEYPSIQTSGAVQELVHDAPWYKVYDMIEAALGRIAASGSRNDIPGLISLQPRPEHEVINELNDLFQDESLAWRVTADGQIAP